MPSLASRPDGRRLKNGGKSGLHTDTAPDNVRRGRPQGKRHRKHTAGSPAGRPSSETARVKGCGKSAPRGRQRRRHGKPRREQNRIGATRGALSAARPCPLAQPLGLVARGARRRASQRNGRHVGAMSPGHTKPGLQAGWRLLRFSFKLGQGGPALPRARPSKPESVKMLRADKVIPAGHWSGAPADTVVLDFDGRYRRRVTMTGVGGLEFLLDLPEAAMLRGGDGLRLEDGRVVESGGAPAPLAEIRAADPLAMTRIAWHLGNRHLLTEMLPRALRIRRDPVIEAMAARLGARVIALEAPFN